MRERFRRGSNSDLTTTQRLVNYRRAGMVLIAVATVVVCCVGLAYGVWAYNRVAPEALAEAKPPTAATLTQPLPRAAVSSEEPVEVESVVLTRFGFEPEEIVRSEGQFLLSVLNRSQEYDIDLRLDSSRGSRLHQQLVARERAAWKDFFKLDPGDYVLTEANHPDWVCRIKITPR